MVTKVRHLKPLGGFRLAVEFSDGSRGTHDFAGMVAESGPMLLALRDETYFARVFLELGAPTWPNGFDIAPEWLRRCLLWVIFPALHLRVRPQPRLSACMDRTSASAPRRLRASSAGCTVGRRVYSDPAGPGIVSIGRPLRSWTLSTTEVPSPLAEPRRVRFRCLSGLSGG